MLLTRPCSTLFPYTTLFRSEFYATVLSGAFRYGGPFLADALTSPAMASVGIPNLGARPIPPTNERGLLHRDRKSTRLNSSHTVISYAVFCLKKKKNKSKTTP